MATRTYVPTASQVAAQVARQVPEGAFSDIALNGDGSLTVTYTSGHEADLDTILQEIGYQEQALVSSGGGSGVAAGAATGSQAWVAFGSAEVRDARWLWPAGTGDTISANHEVGYVFPTAVTLCAITITHSVLGAVATVIQYDVVNLDTAAVLATVTCAANARSAATTLETPVTIDQGVWVGVYMTTGAATVDCPQHGCTILKVV